MNVTEAHKQLLEAQKLLPEDKRVGGLRLQQQHAATINNHQHPVENRYLMGRSPLDRALSFDQSF